MEREFTNGKQEKYTMENGKMEPNMATASGKAKTEIPTSANGSQVKPTAMEFTPGQAVINMRENGKSDSNMAKALTFLLMEMYLLELT